MKSAIARKLELLSRQTFGALKANYRYYVNPRNYNNTGTTNHVTFAVSDYGNNIRYGDYFTALELATELEKYGFSIRFVAKHRGGWYHTPPNTRVLIAMLDDFDPRRIKTREEPPVTVAWARNWFSQWGRNPGLKKYDLLAASSQTAVEELKRHYEGKIALLPIASNPQRFPARSTNDRDERDLCFTGSFWYHERELERLLQPEKLKNVKFEVFGENWEHSSKLGPFSRGFLPYHQLAHIYRTSKIVLDDANHVTKPYGAVNSRVFDALASGALVLTNGCMGAKETFSGELPCFTSSAELHDLIDFYLSNEQARVEKIARLQRIVLSEHTYHMRAEQLVNILESRNLLRCTS